MGLMTEEGAADQGDVLYTFPLSKQACEALTLGPGVNRKQGGFWESGLLLSLLNPRILHQSKFSLFIMSHLFLLILELYSTFNNAHHEALRISITAEHKL